MDLYVIGDTDTVLGFAHAGVRGTAVETEPEAREAFEAVLGERRTMILIITQAAADLIRDEVDAVRFEAERPVIVEVPGPEGPLPDRRTLLELIREAVGIRV